MLIGALVIWFVLTIHLWVISCVQNDISDILGLTFSMDADEEKHILYEKTEVLATYANLHGLRYVSVQREDELAVVFHRKNLHFRSNYHEIWNRISLTLALEKCESSTITLILCPPLGVRLLPPSCLSFSR